MGSCPGGELSWWGVVLVGNCPGGELSLWQIVPVGDCPGGELSNGCCPDTLGNLFI